jgi:hypothetical protein
MRNAILAERIIGLFTDRERAANIVGDLAETAQTRGGVWFWRSVAGAAIGLGWRFAAVFAACAALQMAIAAAAGAILNALSAANHGRALAPIGPALSFSAMLLSGVALYSAFRYGVRDALTRLATATTLVAFAGACLPRTPYAPQAAAAAVLALTIAAGCSGHVRRIGGGVRPVGDAQRRARPSALSTQLPVDHRGPMAGLLPHPPHHIHPCVVLIWGRSNSA